MTIPMSLIARDLVFISYAHEDATWLERLQKFLKPYVREGRLQIWADPYIKAGDLWRREIDTALSRTAVGVVLVSPDCLDSDFIMDVEVPALLAAAEQDQLTIFCIPVSSSAWKTTNLRHYQWAGNPSEPLDLLEVPQRNRALVEITEKLAETATSRASRVVVSTPAPVFAPRRPVTPIVAVPSGQPGAFHGVPELPPHYLPRPEDLDRLRDAVLGGTETAMGITGVSYKLGLQGQGGIGKSVLAAALARDEEVRRAFPDGIYWVTLGQEPELLRIQSDLLRSLGGNESTVTGLENGRRALAEVLNDRSCLVVVDDAWNTSHARALDAVGSRSRLVVTTRDATILTALGAREERVQRLPESLAVELLANWAGSPSGTLPEEARRVAQECGHLPLALAVAGARVRDGLAWADLLDALEQGRLEFLDHPYANVFRSMRLGVDALSPHDRERYLELAVFPEDVRVPESVVLKLWLTTVGLDAPASKALLASFERKALLERSGADTGREIAFHDLQHDFLRILADDLPALHSQLLAGLSEGLHVCDAQFPAWYALDDSETYPWLYLAGHLIATGRSEEMRALLFDYRWLEAKLRIIGISGLLSDFQTFSNDPELDLVAGTLRISAHVLAEQPRELPAQLLGRLTAIAQPGIRSLLSGAESSHRQVWLRPLSNSLIVHTSGLRQTLWGHLGAVRSVAITSDGRRAVSSADDTTLKLWDIERGEEVRTFEGHTDWVLSVAVSADDQRVVSGSADGTVKVWNLEGGAEVVNLLGHESVVVCVAITADGRRVVSGAKDGTMKVWDAERGREICTLTGHTGRVFSVGISEDGRRVISASEDGTVIMWDTDRGQALATLRGHSKWVLSVAITPDGRWAVTGSRDRTLKVWDLDREEEVRTLRGHSGWVVSVAVTAQGRVISSSSDGTVKVWDLEEGTEVRTFRGHYGWVLAVAVTPDGRRAISGSDGGSLKVWDLERDKETWNAPDPSSLVRTIAITPDGKRVLSCSDDGILKMWDVERREEVGRLEQDSGFIADVAIAGGARRILTASSEGMLELRDFETGERLRSLLAHEGEIWVISVTRDGRRVVSGAEDGTLKVWDVDRWEEISILRGHKGPVRAASLTPDERRIVTGSMDATLKIWDLESGEDIRTLQGHQGRVRAIALTTDGKLAVSGSDDGTIKVWDLTFGTESGTPMRHGGRVLTIGLVSDKWLYSGSSDASIKLWNLDTRQVVASFTADAPIRCCVVAPDGVTMVAGDELGKIHFLRLENLPPNRSR